MQAPKDFTQMPARVAYDEFLTALHGTLTQFTTQAFPGKQVNLTINNNGGDTAYTSWQEGRDTVKVYVALPTIDIDSKLPRGWCRRFIAFAVHECSHHLYTDMDYYEKAKSTHGEKFMELVNALEDPRIERRFIEDSHARNAKGLLEALCRWAIDEGGELSTTDPVSGMGFGARERNAAYDLQGYLSRCARDMDAETFRTVQDVIAELDVAKSTADVYAIAETLWNNHRDKLDPPGGKTGKGKGQSGEGKGQGEGEGQSGEGEGQSGKGQGEGQAGKGQGSGDVSGQESQNVSTGSGGQGTGQDSGEVNSAPQTVRTIGEAAAKALVKDISPDDPDNEHWRKQLDAMCGLAEIRRNKGHGIPKRNRLYKQKADAILSDLEAERSLADIAKGQNAARLKKSLAEILTAPANTSWQRFRDTGRLKRPDVARAVMGQKRIFSQRRHKPAVKTAVLLIVDQSGSMAGNGKAETAMQTASAIVSACERLAVPVSVWTYGNGFRQVLDWGGKARDAKAGHLCDPGGGTPTLPITIEAIKIFEDAPRDCTRRLLLNITDGMSQGGPTALQWANEYIRDKAGIEALGIGIGVDYVKHSYPGGYAVVRDLRELMRTGLELLTEAGGKPGKRNNRKAGGKPGKRSNRKAA